jgi:hypothetical protein
MRNFAFVTSALALIVGALALPAAGAADLYVRFDDVQGEPEYDCNDAVCGATVVGYAFTGVGTCVSGCLALPSGSPQLALSFSVARTFSSDACRMKSGGGTVDLSWPDDPASTARATFSFKARDSHAVSFAGSISASTTSALPVGEQLKGYIDFPPNPCIGGTTSGSLAFSPSK